LALGAVADFGAKYCQFTTKVDAMYNVQLTTSPAIEPNACYHQCFLVCRGLSVYLMLLFSLSFVVRWGIF
jgi:hypothetical protein